MNHKLNDLEKFCTYSQTYWYLSLPSRVTSNAKRNLKNLVKSWDKKNTLCDNLVSILNTNSESTYIKVVDSDMLLDYIKVDAASFLLHYQLSCRGDVKEKAILLLKKITSEHKNSASNIAFSVLDFYKINHYNHIFKRNMEYDK